MDDHVRTALGYLIWTKWGRFNFKCGRNSCYPRCSTTFCTDTYTHTCVDEHARTSVPVL